MKNYLFILALCTSLLMVSQKSMGRDFKGSQFDHRIISFNQGMGFSGYGDTWGIANQISNLKTISKHLYLKESLSSWIINGNSWVDGGYENQTGLNLSVEFGISLTKTENKIFGFSGGGYVTYYSMRSPQSGSTNYFGNNLISQVWYHNNNQISPGICIGTSYYSMVNPWLWLNLSAGLYINMNGNISNITIGIGINPEKIKK
ncbi:MAG: hypothetical protein JW798_07675 [Prolixibacteraceae bacterium]|nr:hypothetical protein [Prolixibacteraceae bacterium]